MSLLRRSLVLAGLMAAAACQRRDGLPPPPTDPAGLLAWADSVDSLAARGRGIERVFARKGGRLTPVRDSMQWPEEYDAAVRVFSDSGGRVLRHLELPVSLSGDWFLELAHYFDARGRTVVFASDGRYFRGDECGGVVHDKRRIAYDSAFRARSSTRRLQSDGGRPVDPEGMCGHGYAFFAGEPLASYDALVRAGRAPATGGARAADYASPIVLFVGPDSAEMAGLSRELDDDFEEIAGEGRMYRAAARRLVDSLGIAHADVPRGEATFRVGREVRRFSWRDAAPIWFTVVYDGVSEPRITADMDLPQSLGRLRPSP
jgi:hypothetical protein